MIPKQFQRIIDLYAYEPLDEITIKHLNEHLQATFPGKYRIYSTVNDTIGISFEFDTPEEYTWWALKYS